MANPIDIELSLQEIMQASHVGIMRQVESIKKRIPPIHGEPPELAFQRHIDGALSEMAFAKWINLFWSRGAINAPDVGNHEVRTSHKFSHRLIIRPGDHNFRRYYWVPGLDGKYRIMGWIMGRDGKKPEYLEAPNGRPPAHFVPHGELTL